MSVIQVQNMTKDYGNGRGVFDVSFEINKGEVYGFLGPNGAGKTTTIRHLMGFSRPQQGTVKIFGRDSFRFYDQNMKSVGYIPGEVSLPVGLTGWQFLDMMKKMKNVKSDEQIKRLVELFQFDPRAETKRMSLGDKRKLAIITAFMAEPDVLILDEPTSGLDPVMQDVFVELIKEQKKQGKTIMLSSHMFSEIDTTCDRIAIIKDGRIVSQFVANDLKHSSLKNYKVIFKTKNDYTAFLKGAKDIKVIVQDAEKLTVVYQCEDSKINEVLAQLSAYDVVRFSHLKETLEDYFMKYYVGNKDFGGVL